MKHLAFALVLVFSMTNLAQASTDLLIVKDGSVARCNSGGDIGSRAFSLTAKAVGSLNAIQLEVKTFKCVLADNKLTLVPTALAEAHEVKVNADTYAMKFVTPVIAVTNVDRTAEYGRVALDETKQTQTILVNQNLLTNGKVDITILSLAITEKNGQLFDQGMTFGGHYRLSQQP